ncbi:MAG: CheR family methyltransferase [Pseudomonadales bacterium]|nr:CheR family methyltransferase [Pseudomonadales bacterium]
MSSSSASPARSEREFVFTAGDFDCVRKLIYQHAGIALAPGKQEMVYNRLARRLRARGLLRFTDYLKILEAGDADEWEAFINSLTTNLTSFFREAHHFPVLAEHAQRCWRERRQPLKLWCCAASTGEEPYSMAITLLEAFPSSPPPISILATDVDTHVLAKGQHGIYANERVEKLSAERLRRFFLKGSGANNGAVKVRPELQALVTFKRLNLLDPRWAIEGPFDAIMCRNIMIYFDKETQRRILEKFVPLLRPDGLLFSGHSESLFHAADLFQLRGKTVYEPVPRNPAPARSPS